MGLNNKKQTEQVMNLILSVILLTIGIISAILFFNGFYDPYLTNGILLLMVMIGTVLAISMGGAFTVMSLYGINETRTETT